MGACHVPARNGPMATAGRLLLPPTPPKAPQVPHGVPGTHTHRTGALSRPKRGGMAKKRLKMAQFPHIQHARRRDLGRRTQMHLTRKVLGVRSCPSNPTEPALWPSSRAQKQRNPAGWILSWLGLNNTPFCGFSCSSCARRRQLKKTWIRQIPKPHVSPWMYMDTPHAQVGMPSKLHGDWPCGSRST